MCDTIAELASGTYEEVGWPELLPFIFQSVQSSEARLQESALLIFAQLAHHIMGTLRQYMATLHEVLTRTLQSPNHDVALASMRATAAFVQVRVQTQMCSRSHGRCRCIQFASAVCRLRVVSCEITPPKRVLLEQELEEPAERDRFQSTIPQQLTVIWNTLQAGDEGTAQEALELFIEVAEAHPRFLRKNLTEIVNAMLQVSTATPYSAPDLPMSSPAEYIQYAYSTKKSTLSVECMASGAPLLQLYCNSANPRVRRSLKPQSWRTAPGSWRRSSW